MTDHDDDARAEALQRPPGAPDRWATVTPIGARRPAGHRPPVAAPVDGSLALDAAALGDVERAMRATRPAPELRLVSPSERGTDEVRQWAARFAQAVVEVLGGDRPLQQMLRWTSQRVYGELERRLAILSRTQDAGRRMRTVRPQVRSVHVFHPTPHSAEVSVHVRHGQRSRAIAARLEHCGGRWQCTALQLG